MSLRTAILLILLSVTWAPARAAAGNAPADGKNRPVAAVRKPPDECFARLAEDFVPMANSERSAYYIGATVGTSGLLESALRAGLDQAIGQPREWGGGARGYARRIGSVQAQRIIGNAFEYGASYWLHEDNRYFASGERGIARRLGYTLASTVLARHDNGSRAPSLSVLGGAMGAALISRQWQPRSTTTARDAAIAFGLEIGTRALVNVVREFVPRRLGLILR